MQKITLGPRIHSMTMKPGPWRTGVIVLLGAILLGNCASKNPTGTIPLKPGAAWRDVAKAAGKPTVRFSYVTTGRKYDLVTMENSPNPVVFENSRLFKVLSADAVAEFDRKIAEHLKTVDLPFENGIGGFHAWILTKSSDYRKPAEQKPVTAGGVAESATAGVILTPIAPILLAGGVCYATEHAMTGSDRTRAQAVNEALLASGPSFGTFLNRFGRFDFHTAKGTYQIREYLATDGAFFTGRDFFYEVGFRDGKPLWVIYKNDAVRLHAVRYWSAHR